MNPVLTSLGGLQADTGPDVDREEICGGEDIPVGGRELPPGRPRQPLGDRLDPVPPQDVRDRPSPDLVVQVREGPLNPPPSFLWNGVDLPV